MLEAGSCLGNIARISSGCLTPRFKEWTPPTPWTGPYPAIAGKNGEAWTAGMGTDLILRLNAQTGKLTAYLLPTVEANVRWIQVDSSTTPVTVWVAEVFHQGKIARGRAFRLISITRREGLSSVRDIRSEHRAKTP